MKEIKLSIGQARELYNTNKEFRTTILHDFTDVELGIEPILRDWEELENGAYGISEKVNHVPTAKHAKSMIAFAKLSMLMADLGDECKHTWDNWEFGKHCILRYSNQLWCESSFTVYKLLAFKTESIRDAFLEKHEQLIKDYFMID